MAEFMLILVASAAYFAPALTAAWRSHPKILFIVLLNFFLGFTVIGWGIAMTWAINRSGASVRRYNNNAVEFGGMAVSTSERFNTAFFATFGGFIVVAAIVGLAIHQVRQAGEAFAAKVDHDALTAAHKPLPLIRGASGAKAPARPASQADVEMPKAASTIQIAETVSPSLSPAASASVDLKADASLRRVAPPRHRFEKLYVDGVPLAERIAPLKASNQ